MDSAKRSLIKAICYRILIATSSLIFLYLVTGQIDLALKAGLAFEAFKMLVYYSHERLWSLYHYGMIYETGRTIWFTGLSGSGKSTIATELAERIKKKGYPVQILDGDKVRNTINKGLGFTPEDRERNIFNIAHMAQIMNEAGVVVLVPVISPYNKIRDMARGIIGNFTGVYVKCPLSVCERRDPKGLYKKVRAGEIPRFTGISDPFDDPEGFEITVDTSLGDVDACVELILEKAKL